MSLKDKTWMQNFVTYIKSYFSSDLPFLMISYFSDKGLIELRAHFSLYFTRDKSLKTPFLLYAINGWNNLDQGIKRNDS